MAMHSPQRRNDKQEPPDGGDRERLTSGYRRTDDTRTRGYHSTETVHSR
jgi:hypothetical protein